MKKSSISIGLVVNDITIISMPFFKHTKCGRKISYVTCKCSCGKEWDIFVSDVGRCKSCGCKRVYGMIERSTKHGMSRTKEYHIHNDMLTRCHKADSKPYKWYGARGIVVCKRWRDANEGLKNFMSDMGPMPTLKHQIERIDVNGNYCPENCRWATQLEQQRNRRNNRVISYNGESMCVSAWAERIGVTKTCVLSRLKMNIPLSTVLSKEKIRPNVKKLLTLNGKTKRFSDWAKDLSIPMGTIETRYRRGLTTEQILNTNYIKPKIK